MGHRLSKIYTKTGDKGTTGLGDGTRVAKDDGRVEAYGTVDELNSAIGMVIAEPDVPEIIKTELTDIQHDLFNIGGELSVPKCYVIEEKDIEKLENILDEHNKDLPMLKEFILPGGSRAASVCHLARTICRRAERRVVSLQAKTSTNKHSLTYLNRLSDLLFVIARVIARSNGGEEILWQRNK